MSFLTAMMFGLGLGFNRVAAGAASDVEAPAAPLIAGFSGDTGAADDVTTDTDILISGTAEAGSTVRVYDGVTLLGIATGSSNWTYQTGTLASGNHSFTAKATDAANNVSAASSALAVLVVAPPVAHWTFDTGTITGADVEDVTGNGHDGELSGSPAIVAGIVGDKALSLDGVNDFFECEDHPALNSTSRSISMWLKNITSTATRTLISHSNPVDPSGIFIEYREDSGDKRFRANAQRGVANLTQATFDLPDGADTGDHHYVFVYDETLVNGWAIYVDKVKTVPSQFNSNGTPQPLTPAADDFYVGNYTGFPNFLAVDKLDDLRIYNRALTQAEVDAIFDGKV